MCRITHHTYAHIPHCTHIRTYTYSNSYIYIIKSLLDPNPSPEPRTGGSTSGAGRTGRDPQARAEIERYEEAKGLGGDEGDPSSRCLRILRDMHGSIHIHKHTLKDIHIIYTTFMQHPYNHSKYKPSNHPTHYTHHAYTSSSIRVVQVPI
ncbi:hypothetical protein EON63_16750 [archaeon]|nr:MAG: hypothetical protein EON63_16750 [archaeon]